MNKSSSEALGGMPENSSEFVGGAPEISGESDKKSSEFVGIPTPEEVNAANAAASTGKVSDDGQGAAFFTAADVRAMSREQVRRNLKKILRSMESGEF